MNEDSIAFAPETFFHVFESTSTVDDRRLLDSLSVASAPVQAFIKFIFARLYYFHVGVVGSIFISICVPFKVRYVEVRIALRSRSSRSSRSNKHPISAREMPFNSLI